MAPDLSRHFPRYTEFDPLVPVWCVTPKMDRTYHRFFDTSPFSPSGRYMGLTRMPFEDRMPQPGDAAEIVLVDLETGEEHVVAETRGWDTQLGAQVQWGADDTQLFFNDMDTEAWRPFGVVLNPASGARKELDGTVYMVSPDGKRLASPCLLRTGATQAGYGVLVPPERVPENRGASAEDGIFVTDTETGAGHLLASLKEIVEATQSAFDPDTHAEGNFFGAHVKWNSTGDRLMFVLRWLPQKPGGKMSRNVVTLKSDGSEPRIAISNSLWGKGGHHPDWCPDGKTVMMNLNLGEGMRFVQANYDGADFKVMTEAVRGSGHPTLHPNGRHIVTDAYPHEPVAFGDGTTPIRLVDLDAGEEKALVRIQIVPPYSGPKGELRVDPHPAWDFGFRRVAFNGCPDGTRRVYVADLTDIVE